MSTRITGRVAKGPLAVAAGAAVVGLWMAGTSSGGAAPTTDPAGTWAMRFEAEVGHTTETVIGALMMGDAGRCRLVLRMNVGGLGPADKSSSECSWEWLESHPGIGTIAATLPYDEHAEFEFVIGDEGRRMFLMLTAPAGFPSSGEAIRH